MTHTPGPWKCEPDPYNDGTPYFRFKAGDPYVDGEKMGFTASAIMREADARLIAAAPALFEALTELVALVRGECPSLLNEDSGGSARLDMAIDAALVLAKGEASNRTKESI